MIKFYHSDKVFKNMKIHHYEKNSHCDVKSSKRGRLIPQMNIIQKVTSDCFLLTDLIDYFDNDFHPSN